MQKQLEMLIECHKAFEQSLRYSQPDTLPPSEISLRKKLMEEEVSEWAESFNEDVDLPIIEQKRHRAKELADILYVVFGTIITEGLQDNIEQVFEEVHKSNMSKLVDGKALKREDGKFLKGPNYKLPDLNFLK
jgi:predicted HAD superfamily Cof-like phosphohydrolase